MWKDAFSKFQLTAADPVTIGMACQKVWKQDRDDIKVKANIYNAHLFFALQFLSVKEMYMGVVYLPSLLYLVSILFGMPSLYLFPFLNVFF